MVCNSTRNWLVHRLSASDTFLRITSSARAISRPGHADIIIATSRHDHASKPMVSTRAESPNKPLNDPHRSGSLQQGLFAAMTPCSLQTFPLRRINAIRWASR